MEVLEGAPLQRRMKSSVMNVNEQTMRPSDRPATIQQSASDLDALARLLDSAFRIPFTRIRFGVDAIIGLIPGVGDVWGGIASAYIVLAAARRGAPKAVLLKMLFNIGVELLVGTIPVLGDLFDVTWKANVRNVGLLERHLEQPAAATQASRRWLIGLAMGMILLIGSAVVLTVLVVRAAIGWLVP